MPLDFTSPRAEPTLGRAKDPAEVEARERRIHLVAGLRSQGGKFGTEDGRLDLEAGQLVRISRYSHTYAQEEREQAWAKAAPRTGPVPRSYTPFSEDEIDDLTATFLDKGFTWERKAGNLSDGRLLPQVRVWRVTDRFVTRFDFYGEDPPGRGSAMGIQLEVTDKELHMAKDLRAVVENTLARGYYALGKLEVDNGAVAKKLTIPQH